jgi:hypothetical protein
MLSSRLKEALCAESVHISFIQQYGSKLMTIHPPSDSEKNRLKTSGASDSPDLTQKPQSAGFAESSGFRPSWLDTGPLPTVATSAPLHTASQPTTDDYRARQSSRPRLHLQAEAESPDEPPIETDTQPWEAESATEDTAARREADSAVPSAAGSPPEGDIPRWPPGIRRKWPDRLSTGLLIASLILLGIAALIYFVNPFTRLALGSASLARPVTSPETAPPRTGSGAWCLQGEFLESDGESLRLLDNGNGGDILAEDRVFTLGHTIVEPGAYTWQVADCENPTLAYPQTSAWVVTSEADQQVTFIFDSNEREDPLFFPIPFVVTALDDTDDFRIVGSFQDWDPTDPTNLLEPISSGIFQQVRRIARSGSYEAYVIAGEESQAVDAYGRTTEPIPFSFETSHNGDYVVFLVDTDRGRASVIYDMPPLITNLAFGNGHRLLSLGLAALAAALLVGLALRLIVIRNPRLQMETGCPQCGEQELMRISRHKGDRFLHLIGLPAYRYRCRYCTWEGLRLSEEGRTVSPGATMTSFDHQ